MLIPMANQMVHVPSSPFSLYPGQSLTVGSISWVINTNGEGKIVEMVQDNPTLVMPTSTPADLISEPIPRLSSSLRAHRLAPRQPRKSIDEDDLIASIDRVDKGLVDCLSLVESVLD